MKLAECPVHGRAALVNAGAPNVVRCAAPGSCATGVLEPCRRCRGTGADGVEPEWVGCSSCSGTGWLARATKWGSPFPVS